MYALTSLMEQLRMREECKRKGLQVIARLTCSPWASSPVAYIREENPGLGRPLVLHGKAFLPLNNIWSGYLLLLKTNCLGFSGQACLPSLPLSLGRSLKHGRKASALISGNTGIWSCSCIVGIKCHKLSPPSLNTFFPFYVHRLPCNDWQFNYFSTM